MNNTISEKQTPRTTLHNEDGKIIFNGLKSIPYEEARFLVDSEEFQAHITLAMAYYEALSFQEIVKGTQDEKNIIPLEKLLNLDTSGKFKQGIFSKICENNPRISERYDAGRLCMKNQGNNSVEFSILHKNAGLAIHIYHIDESWNWIRDAYLVNPLGNLEFESYITEKNAAIYEENIHTSEMNGHMESPDFSEYAGSIPLNVYDPLKKIGTVKNIVRRVVAKIVL